MEQKLINKFPGYEWKRGEDGKYHNFFRGEDVGRGGYNYAAPGMYGRTVVLDVSGMHPASIRAMNCFGDYTKRFGDIVDLRLAIKHKDFDKARKMMDGQLAKYLDDEKKAKALAGALKIAVNSVYGLTSASFQNVMKDPRNVNNIVALRGALFMASLRPKVEALGYKVISIKTDSIKIVNFDDQIIEFVKHMGALYGYNFEIENIFDRICLVNVSTFIAHCAEDDPETPNSWLAKAEQFAVPYVHKTLFTHEDIVFSDVCETMSVNTALYLKPEDGEPEFIGRVGQFTPIKPGFGGRELLREGKDKDGNQKFGSANGAKGYLWCESEYVKEYMGGLSDAVDRSYYDSLVDKAVEEISKYGDFEQFTDLEHPYPNEPNKTPCLSPRFKDCLECPYFNVSDTGIPDCFKGLEGFGEPDCEMIPF